MSEWPDGEFCYNCFYCGTELDREAAVERNEIVEVPVCLCKTSKRYLDNVPGDCTCGSFKKEKKQKL